MYANCNLMSTVIDTNIRNRYTGGAEGGSRDVFFAARSGNQDRHQNPTGRSAASGGSVINT
jgi:hypothetical protein